VLEVDDWLSPTSVGATLRFFFSCPLSSRSLSPASRLTPLTLLVVLRGVCGGVVIGMLGIKPRGLPAPTPEMFPARSVGLLMIVPAAVLAYEAWVATEEVEFDRVGEDGRLGGPAGAGGGDGATDKLDEVRWWPERKGEGGAMTEVGVGSGVVWAEATALLMDGCLAVGVSPVYTWPSSPGAKVRVEQNPSEEVISNVRPSMDLRTVSR
jgi:hypothetical protein